MICTCARTQTHIQYMHVCTSHFQRRKRTLPISPTDSFSLDKHLHTNKGIHKHTHTARRAGTARNIWCCVDPRSWENLRSVSPPPSHVLLFPAVIPSLWRTTRMKRRSTDAPVYWAGAALGCRKGWGWGGGCMWVCGVKKGNNRTVVCAWAVGTV